MKPDVLIAWPTNCDYPVWRRWLAVDRERFAKVIVAFSPYPAFHSYTEHVRATLSGLDVACIDTRWEDGRDWRDAAVNAALDASDADWVWFTEQDFFVRDPVFWRVVSHCANHAGVLGTHQGESRWHPCCLFVKRTLVEQTRRDFSVTPEGDHFSAFGNDLAAMYADTVDLDYWITGRKPYDHTAGLSHNHTLVSRGEPVTYKPAEFAAYLEECLQRTDDLDARWVGQAAGWLAGWYAYSEEGE